MMVMTDGGDCSDGENYGSECRFTCDEGYELKGSPSVLCDDKGWNASSPRCKSKSHWECLVLQYSALSGTPTFYDIHAFSTIFIFVTLHFFRNKSYLESRWILEVA